MPPLLRTKLNVRTKGDPAFRDLLRQTQELGQQYVAVGILDATRTYPDGKAMLGQVALWQEFGTHTAQGLPMVPPRSFLRTPIDQGLPGIEALKGRLLQRIQDGKLTVRTGLDSLGADIVRRMQNAIKRRIDPPLRPYTLKKRREQGIAGTIPLLATQFLYNNIHFAVRRTGLGDLLSSLSDAIKGDK